MPGHLFCGICFFNLSDAMAKIFFYTVLFSLSLLIFDPATAIGAILFAAFALRHFSERSSTKKL